MIALLPMLSAASTPRAGADGASVFDAHHNVSQFYGVPLDVMLEGLRRLPVRSRIGHASVEGDRDTVVTVDAATGVQLKITFDDDGKLYQIETSSPNAVGAKGIGVGSPLSAVKAAWPSGRLLYGWEDGAFATFVTGTNVLLRFNPDDLPAQAFDKDWCKSRATEIPEIKVQTISVFTTPSLVPAPAAIHCAADHADRNSIRRGQLA
jgi:hypothetical protein